MGLRERWDAWRKATPQREADMVVPGIAQRRGPNAVDLWYAHASSRCLRLWPHSGPCEPLKRGDAG